MYQVLESAGSVEICLVLASVGFYDYTSTLSVPVTLKLLTKEMKNSFLPTGKSLGNQVFKRIIKARKYEK